MAHSVEDAPLARGSLADSEEVLITPPEARRGSNSRALKVAGLTTLACLLLASQVFTAYMVFSQKQQIHSLQKNSEKMDRQLTRTSHAPVRMPMHMNTLPLLTEFTDDEGPKRKTPLIKLQDTAIVSVEQQLKNLLLDSQLPQFNETFQANLESLKHQMNESEWKSLETWMRFWLIFQMAQQKPATPTAEPVTQIKTKCQMEAAPGPGKIGSYKPQCDQEGRYMPMQCWYPTGFCWCVDQTGTVIEGTTMRGRPDCQRGRGLRRMMVQPLLMQKTITVDDKADK
ncbi:CD74 molecule, major histocompatibility complex, class II invariant chain a [Echeneis naucrates]|uniref:Thyroglobulin type-1 domain-containing protein n=1 Tax=Echeneis naucrates TaxID=173247 RepID=A0A665U1S0_ECHNA|nr:HLA class II histocompatibility antigen gamma chain [Echeneis naucrates]